MVIWISRLALYSRVRGFISTIVICISAHALVLLIVEVLHQVSEELIHTIPETTTLLL